MQALDPSPWEAEAGGFYEASLVYKVELHLKTKQTPI